jgi:hypothetical protein
MTIRLILCMDKDQFSSKLIQHRNFSSVEKRGFSPTRTSYEICCHVDRIALAKRMKNTYRQSHAAVECEFPGVATKKTK